MMPMLAGESPRAELNRGIMRFKEAKASSTIKVARHMKMIFLVRTMLPNGAPAGI